MEDYYKVLGVPRGASQQEIEERYRALSVKYHPDRNRDNPLQDLAREEFKKVQEAYQVLSDPALRAEYDRVYSGVYGRAGGAVYSESDITDAQNIRTKYIVPYCIVGFIIGALAVGISVVVTVPVAYVLALHNANNEIRSKYGERMLVVLKMRSLKID